MEIIKVVLTGGPCAGKTTALNSIREYLAKNNISFVSVPETATELILNEIKPLGEDTIYKFQSLVFKKQLSKEQIAEEYLREVKQEIDKCIIIYDQAIIDNKAYLSGVDDFKNIVKQSKMTEIDILDSYDLVLDLLSVASCKPEVYNMLNEVRMEDLDTAIKVDEKTSNVWVAHRNLKILSSSISLEEETKIIIEYIKEVLSGKRTTQIRKFLVNDNFSNYNIYNKYNSEELLITDYFLEINDDEYNYVISKRKLDNNVSYVFTIYDEIDGKRHIIKDKKITKEEYYGLINRYKIIDKIEKREVNFIYNKQKFKLCFYKNYTALELEENKLNEQLKLPENLCIIGEIPSKSYEAQRIKKKVRCLCNGNI